jgi:hypothetical protein
MALMLAFTMSPSLEKMPTVDSDGCVWRPRGHAPSTARGVPVGHPSVNLLILRDNLRPYQKRLQLARGVCHHYMV